MPLSQSEAEAKLKQVKGAAPAFIDSVLSAGLAATFEGTRADPRERGLAQMGRAYRNLNPVARFALLKALGGKLSGPLSKALEQSQNRTYQAGLLRLPYRAPDLPSVTDHLRGQILMAAADLRKRHDQGAPFFAEWIGHIDAMGWRMRADLILAGGLWPEWQARVFTEARVQPFKQVFRELYVPTELEKGGHSSTRYGGHQVQPRQALAILGKRGWVVREEGVSKTLHHANLTARLGFDELFFSPGDIEGLTIQRLVFTKPGQYDSLPIDSIPPILFSETMRDLDLVVSVASMTGIDPEASESTVEMRANVVRSMAQLMGLSNVEPKGKHVIIGGKLGEYTVHLGSGVVHQRAKGQLVIVAVRQPQRGRLFLPFVDDDPRTAEVVSKVLLLARDHEIKDPTILSQIQ